MGRFERPTCPLREGCSAIELHRLERVTGIEPVFPPWEGGVITTIRYPQTILNL